MKYFRRITLSSALLLFASQNPASAQDLTQGLSSVDFGLVAGAFSDYPSRLKDHCGQEIGAVGGEGSVWLTSRVAIQGNVMLGGGFGGDPCPLPGPPILPREPGDTGVRYTADEALKGGTFFSTGAGVLFDLFPDSRGSVRLKSSMGRMWNKDLNHWLVGGGLRYRFGGHAVVVDFERWSFTYDVQRELVEYDADLNPVVLESELLQETENPYMLRVGYEIRIR